MIILKTYSALIHDDVEKTLIITIVNLLTTNV